MRLRAHNTQQGDEMKTPSKSSGVAMQALGWSVHGMQREGDGERTGSWSSLGARAARRCWVPCTRAAYWV